MTNEEAIKWLLAIDKKYIHGGDEFYDEQRHEAIKTAIQALEARPKGKWMTVKLDTELGTFEVKNKQCNKCGHSTKYEYPFCPWCGADMKGGAEE